ncbi:DUF4105 domain-containing protein [Phragmitibacter flavus]|nr:DUF4105 domain-containing protein [Phragmitibacter flavus]
MRFFSIAGAGRVWANGRRRVLEAGSLMCRVILVLWGALAIYWSNLPWGWMRVLTAVGFVVLGFVLLWRVRSVKGWRIFAGVFVGLLIWWASIRPTHDRVWKIEQGVLPRAVVEGDMVMLNGMRNFDYRTKSDFEVRYEERVVDLAKIKAVDFFISYWKPGPVAHTFVSFVFEDEDTPPVCVSIEARLENGEVYSALASCFKQAELIYVVGEERDIVGSRMGVRGEQVYRYRTRATPEQARRLFVTYLESINELADQPEFYHLLRNNCTVNIDRHASRDGKGSPFDLRLLLNGYVDQFMYEKGVLDTSVPFEELRRRALIDDKVISQETPADFSERIRRELEGQGE